MDLLTDRGCANGPTTWSWSPPRCAAPGRRSGRCRLAAASSDASRGGLDPQSRRDTWDLIEGVRSRGVTIVLVTPFMEEAEPRPPVTETPMR
ncbi:hypothetical protein [Nonomuraea sp. SYSU D8015]|uniref:hypothetical protein n=1 Tax=Nonomuraea sp. SYSU D8015 TaxID=2593644 RepID=UPI003FA5F2FA